MEVDSVLGTRPRLGLRRGALFIKDGSGAEWHTLSPVASVRCGGTDYRPGKYNREFSLEISARGDSLTGKLLWRRRNLSIPLSAKAIPEGLQVKVGPAEGLAPEDRLEVEFPRGLGSASAGEEGYLILPIGLGAICDFSRQRKSRVLEQHIYSGGQTGITMPLFGTVSGNKGICCVVETPYDCKLKTDLNRGRRRTYAQTPVWVIDNRTNHLRRAHFTLLEEGSYTAAAKTYRRKLEESGRLVSLTEKAKGCPEVNSTVGSLLGHRGLSFVEPDGADPCDERNAYGFFRRAIREGFDRVIAHDVNRGDPKDMRAAARFARSLATGYRLCVYENYLDIFRPGEQPERPGTKMYPDWDEGLIARRQDGSLRPNWRVRRKGQPDIWTYTVCAAKRLDVALPQMEDLRRIFGRGSIYIDVEGAVPLFDCFDSKHPVTKEEDAKLRIALLKEVKRRFGVVTTEALPQDFMAPWVEVGSYFSVFPHSGYGNSAFRIMPPLLPVPLHTLVWHGCILNQTGTGTNFYQSDQPHAALFGWLADTMDDKGRRISYQLRDTALAEMLSHQFLTKPRIVIGPDDAFHCDDVQMTRFSDGTYVVANFASLPYRWRGRTIESRDFIIGNERLSVKLDSPPKARCSEELRFAVELRNTWDRPVPDIKLRVLARGVAHAEEPVHESGIGWLDKGGVSRTEFSFRAPGVAGKMWAVVTASAAGDQPFAVTELAECEVC